MSDQKANISNLQESKVVFVDSSALFAHFHDGDRNHKSARETYERLKEERYKLVTTNLIVAEAHQLMIKELKHHIARKWLKAFYENIEFNILMSGEEIESKARNIVYEYTDKDFSLADAVSFVIMKELLRTQIAFEYDKHFRQYGFLQAKPEIL